MRSAAISITGLLLLIAGITMFVYGLKTASFHPATGNDNIVYCLLAVPLVLLGFASFVWTAATFKLPAPNDAYSENVLMPGSWLANEDSSGSVTIVECQKCSKSISTSLAELETGIDCPVCGSAITIDDIHWGTDDIPDNLEERDR